MSFTLSRQDCLRFKRWLARPLLPPEFKLQRKLPPWVEPTPELVAWFVSYLESQLTLAAQSSKLVIRPRGGLVAYVALQTFLLHLAAEADEAGISTRSLSMEPLIRRLVPEDLNSLVADATAAVELVGNFRLAVLEWQSVVENRVISPQLRLVEERDWLLKPAPPVLANPGLINSVQTLFASQLQGAVGMVSTGVISPHLLFTSQLRVVGKVSAVEDAPPEHFSDWAQTAFTHLLVVTYALELMLTDEDAEPAWES